jgi:hypothetical protein
MHQIKLRRFMRRFLSLLVLSICPLLASCFYNRTTSLNPEASIVVVRKADAPKECQEMGAVAGYQGVEAQNFIGISAMETPEGMMNRLKNEAAKVGANWVTLTSPGSGIAYKCPTSALSNG